MGLMATDVVEISSDEEDCGVDKLPDEDYDWVSEFFNDKELEGLYDISVVDELSAPASTLKASAADAGGGRQEDSDDECVVLDGDPDKPVAVADDKSGGGDTSDELLIVGEKGQLACRDYPHPRHLCARFHFSSTQHENYCEMCHCYVCDSPAPCIYWSNGHCHSTDKQGNWKSLRMAFKQRNKAGPNPQKPPDIILSMKQSLQNTVFERRRHPISLPVMPSRPSTLRPCSLTQVPTGTPISQKQHSHRLFSCGGQRLGDHQTRQQLPFSGMHYLQREKRGIGNLGAQVMQPHAKFRRIGTTENSIPRNNTSQLQQVISHHNRLIRDSTQTSRCPPATLVEESMKKWQEILEGVAADLGVSDTGNESNTESQLVSSQPIACDQFPSHTNTSQNTEFEACSLQVPDLDSLDVHSWSYTNSTAPDITEQNRFELSQPVTVQSSNPSVSGERHLMSFLDSADQKPVLGADETGLLELDPDGLLLYDFDDPWSSTTQV